MSKLIKLPEPHIKLWSLDESFYDPNEFINFVAVQAIGGKGRVDLHKHDDVTEIIYLEPGAFYRGLDSEEIVSCGNSYVVPVGVYHGASRKSRKDSKGQWVSVKVNKDMKYLGSKSLGDVIDLSDEDDGVTVAHSFEKDDKLLVVGFSHGMINLAYLVNSYFGGGSPPHSSLLCLPLIKSFVNGREYGQEYSRNRDERAGRYLSIGFGKGF